MKISPVVKAIKEEMDRQGLSAATLASMAEVSMSNVYGILNGQVESPGLGVVEKLARALKLKVVAQ